MNFFWAWKSPQMHPVCVVLLIWFLQLLWLVHPAGCHAWINKLNPDHLCSCLVTWEKGMSPFHLQLSLWKKSRLVSLIRGQGMGEKTKCIISPSGLSITVLQQTHFLSSITSKAFGQWSDPGRLSLAGAVNGVNGILNLLCGDPLKVQVPISERVIRLI